MLSDALGRESMLKRLQCAIVVVFAEALAIFGLAPHWLDPSGKKPLKQSLAYWRDWSVSRVSTTDSGFLLFLGMARARHADVAPRRRRLYPGLRSAVSRAVLATGSAPLAGRVHGIKRAHVISAMSAAVDDLAVDAFPHIRAHSSFCFIARVHKHPRSPSTA